MRIAVLGGGNGSFAAAGDMALAGHDVRLWRRDAEAVKQHNAAGSTITVKDFRGRREAKPSLVTNNIGEAARDAELILCPAPATAQHDIARTLAPHLRDGQVVFLRPAHSALISSRKRSTMPVIAPTRRLPRPAPCRGSRASTGARGRDHHPRKRLPTGVLPLGRKDHALAVIGERSPA